MLRSDEPRADRWCGYDMAARMMLGSGYLLFSCELAWYQGEYRGLVGCGCCVDGKVVVMEEEEEDG